MDTVTDAAGSTISYTYGNESSKMWGLPTAVTAPNGVTTNTAYDLFGRVTQTSVAELVTLQYNYSNGNLTSITRTANGKSQTYTLSYDAFGNTTGIQVGSRTLATYTYGTGNGPLIQTSYGNGLHSFSSPIEYGFQDDRYFFWGVFVYKPYQ